MPKLIAAPALLCLAAITMVFVSLALAGNVLAQQPKASESGGELVDRVVALVGEDPVFLSDIERAITLGPASPFDGEDRESFERRVLAGLVDQRLRSRAVERYDLPPPPAADIEAQIDTVTERLGGARALLARLAELGLDEEGLRQLIERQLRVMGYVDQRLRPRIFVEPEAIRAYYEDVLIMAMQRQGEGIPPLEEVRDDIRALLREQRLDLEIERWTAELRNEVEVIDLYTRPERELPPVVLELGGS